MCIRGFALYSENNFGHIKQIPWPNGNIVFLSAFFSLYVVVIVCCHLILLTALGVQLNRQVEYKWNEQMNK